MSEQRDRILACACDLYLENGLDGFSMRKLARCLGVTAPALYRHFESREQVLHEVVREAYERFSRHLYVALQGRTPLERFRMAGEGYLTFALENPRLYHVLFAAPDQLGWEALPPELESQACAVGQFWNDRVRECMDAGILEKADPHETGLTLWGHAHGLVKLYLQGSLRMEEAEFRELYGGSHRRILAGLASREFGRTLLDEERGSWTSHIATEGSAPSETTRTTT